MSSVGEILDVVQQTQNANNDYLALQVPIADRLDQISLRQAALAQLIGEHVADLAACKAELDKCLHAQPAAATIISEASFNLEITAMGTENPDLQAATGAMVTVSNEVLEFGGHLVMMSTNMAGQESRFAELVRELNETAEVSYVMADDAKRHVGEVVAANEMLALYAASASG